MKNREDKEEMITTLITVFTPTYNRASELIRVYESLKSQTSFNFVWTIIDDGSSDYTESIVKNWIEQNEIPIEYFKQTNRGKTKTMNRGISLVKTPLWMVLDSDDWLHNQAIQKIEVAYPNIENDQTICGMIGLRRTPDDQSMQRKEIPEEFTLINYQHMRYKLGISPEYIEVFKSEIIKNFRFPEVPGEKYFPLSYLHDELSQFYEFYVLRAPIMYIEYQENGMTKKRNDLILNNPIGYMLFKKQLLEYAPTFKVAVVSAVTYNSAALLAKSKLPVKTIKGKVLALITFPLGIVDYFIRFKLKRNVHLEKTFD